MKENTLKFLSMMIIIGIAVINIANAQPVTGSGTGNKVPRWNGTGSLLWDSQINDNGTNVGIGIVSTSNKLTVNGNIDIVNQYAYRINNQNFLWHYTIPTNIYLGENTGNYSAVTGNNDNTFLGYNIGTAINQGHCNIVVGSMGSTGSSLTDGNWNVMIGFQAGLMTDEGLDNTFVGHDAGHSNLGPGGSTVPYGCHNSFYGDEAGYTNDYGYYNTAIGAYALHSNSTGINSTCLGYRAGYTSTLGTNNTFVGAYSDCGPSSLSLTNASAIGYNAIVNYNNQMILGGDYTEASIHHSTFVGIGLSGTLNGGIGPQNSLEINVDPARSSTNPDGHKTATGLRFTQVRKNSGNNTITSPAQQTYNQKTIEPWGKVLTVDENGDVGLTDDLGGGGTLADNGLTFNASHFQLGHAYPGGSGADLLHTSEIPMNNFNLLFTDLFGNIDGAQSSIGIGSTTPRGKVDIFRNHSKYLINSPTALYVENVDDDAYHGNSAIGINNQTHSRNSYNLGILSEAYNGYYGNVAGRFMAVVPTIDLSSSFSYNIGGYFQATGSVYNFGVIGSALFLDDYYKFSVGVYGEAPGYPVGWPQPALGTGLYAGYFNGDVTVTNNLWFPSDSTLKTNIQPLQNISALLDQINCYSYIFDTTKFGNHVNMPKTLQYGFLAQEVENIFPNMVTNGVLPPKIDSSDQVVVPAQAVKMVDYPHFIPLLIEGYKELSSRVTDLESIIQSCCGAARVNNTRETEPIQIKLDNATGYILYQNEPNPYSNTTNIRYFLPENVSDAKITFQNNTGKTLKEVNITTTGQGSLQVDGSDLKNGIYTYSLVIGQKIVDTKKMVKAK